MKKKIYFIQPNLLVGSSVYFPYAAGVLCSYAFQFEEISSEYELEGIVLKEETDEDLFRLIKEPFLVAFSTCFWNYKYNIEAAKKIKNIFPDAVICFGGHQITRDISFLEEHNFTDILIFGEGELPFYRILRNLAENTSLDEIPNIAFRDGEKIIKTADVPEGVEAYPSPYTSGIFEKNYNVPENFELNAQLETNRGCPYHCSFCDWCEYDVPIRKFSLEQVKRDLDWMSENRISYVLCVDSNFGIFERDEEIARYAAELKNKNGYPEKFMVCSAKNKTERNFKINKLLHEAGMSKGATLAFQSMSETVLQNVSRKNMNKDELIKQLELYRNAGIPSYSELILGLPGETLESFCKGVCELIELGQHDTINVFRCEVFPNSELARKEYIEKFGIKTATGRINVNHCQISSAVFSGGMDYIVETDTMSGDELISANLFSDVIQSMHCRGMLQSFALFLHNEKSVSYYDFYSEFVKWALAHNGYIGSVIRKIRDCISSIDRGEADFSYINLNYGNITWPYDEAILISFIDKIDLFYSEIEGFLLNYDIDKNVLKELLAYQKNLIVTPSGNDAVLSFEHNWKTYFESILLNKHVTLQKKNTDLRFFADNVPTDLKEYAKLIIWYGRRNKKTIRNVEIV